MGLFDKEPKKTPKFNPFDLNNDGKVDAGEQFMAYKLFEEMTKGTDKKKGKD